MLLSSGTMRRVVGGTITILGVVDGTDIKVFSGALMATTKTANGEPFTEATGPGDAGVAVMYQGNRYFGFKIDGFAVLGARALGNYTKSNATMTLKFDSGDSWTGHGVIESVTKTTNVNKVPGKVPVSVQGMISAAAITAGSTTTP